LEPLDRVFYIRAILGLVAGVAVGLAVGPGIDQATAIGIAFGISIVFYIISDAAAKKVSGNIPKKERRKVATNGIFPFIFLLLMFMIITYTMLHQNIAS
jgi:protein-S-isoprenylcysteine O-methyltransferase Ste14